MGRAAPATIIAAKNTSIHSNFLRFLSQRKTNISLITLVPKFPNQKIAKATMYAGPALIQIFPSRQLVIAEKNLSQPTLSERPIIVSRNQNGLNTNKLPASLFKGKNKTRDKIAEPADTNRISFPSFLTNLYTPARASAPNTRIPAYALT